MSSWISSLLRSLWTLLGCGSSSSSSPLGPETAASSSSMYSHTIQNYRYDVFISFRGDDTRNTFVDHLYAHLLRKGIFVFKDDKRLKKGKSTLQQLVEAIRESRVSIIVFSKDYASSTWCLDEMATIDDHRQESKQIVFPIFYDVDPSHVRYQNGVYEDAFVSHRRKFKQDSDKVHRWERAMTGLASSVGWDVRNKPEFEEIENIVQAKIVRGQFPAEQGSWSRLWLHQDFFHVMMTETGTDNVKAIVLDQKEDDSEYKIDGLLKMKNLTLLILYHKKFSGSLNFLSHKLRYLLWHGYPFESLPSFFTAFDLVELNMPNSNIERVWEGPKNFRCLKRMDLSNSKYLIETPDFSWVPKLERLDLSGCTNLSLLHPSIGLLSKLAFLSLQNCSNLVSINFDNGSNLSSLKVLHLSGCTKLEKTPDFTWATNLEYLDIDGCTSLLLVHESIGALSKLTFLSFRDCENLMIIRNDMNTMISLKTLDLCGCLKLTELPLEQSFNSSFHLESLIFLDIGFCNLLELPEAIGELRSGLYVFDCPKVAEMLIRDWNWMSPCKDLELAWLVRLIEEPLHFRCGFDIVVPWGWENIPRWFNQPFKRDSVIRIMHFNMDANWIGFAFCVVFEVINRSMPSSSPHCSSSTPLRHPLYLSFESEHTEEYFDMPLNLELGKIHGSKHLWIIYISRKHCHFVETGAHITFKAQPGFKMNKWGIRKVIRQDIDDLKRLQLGESLPPHTNLDYEEKNYTSSDPKIQLPYNWLLTEEDEVENNEAKAKEINLSNVGL
ncbi:hypothetical protein VNO77_28403 [Canavalia gladiata]|uniref:TIR domain-containing protein n=1 Tax=Canavalia gladiata TaxID=3824 RepID=A0AAN9Q4S5_CANGL